MDKLRTACNSGKPRFLADEDADDGDVYSPDHIIQKLYDSCEQKLKELFENCMKIEH